jgi:hypothetical protein
MIRRPQPISSEMRGLAFAVRQAQAVAGATVFWGASSATIYEPALVSQGIGPRNPVNHTPVGITISEPAPNSLVFGRTVRDLTCGQLKEDFFVAELAAGTFAAWSPSALCSHRCHG